MRHGAPAGFAFSWGIYHLGQVYLTTAADTAALQVDPSGQGNFRPAEADPDVCWFMALSSSEALMVPSAPEGSG